MGWFSYLSIAISLLWLALLSRRLGQVTHAPPYYIGLLVASATVAFGAVGQLVGLWLKPADNFWIGWVLIYNGLPAIGITLGVIFAWRYWSWLFAERD